MMSRYSPYLSYSRQSRISERNRANRVVARAVTQDAAEQSGSRVPLHIVFSYLLVIALAGMAVISEQLGWPVAVAAGLMFALLYGRPKVSL